MTKKESPSWPLPESLKLRALRFGTVLISQLADSDKKSPNVQSVLNIPYTRYKRDNWLRFDWHCPKMCIKTNQMEVCPTIFYFHGGGWSSADKSLYTYHCKELAERGFNVINVNYRLIPEYTMETVIDDCVKAIKFALQNYQQYAIDKENVFFMGDSAGAHISALLAGWKNNKIIDLNCNIKALGLYYGVYDFTKFYNHPFKLLQTYHNMFVSVKTIPKELENFYYLMSPINFVTSDFPPCFITSGEVDKLHNDSKNFVKILKDNNVETDILFFSKERKDGRHAFLNINMLAAKQALLRVVEFFKKHI